MKVIWEEDDIIVGRKFMKKGTSEIWIIGYTAFTNGEKYVTVSLSDGMVTEAINADTMAKRLTQSNYLPIELFD